MAPNDVVSHKVATSAARTWTGRLKGIELPRDPFEAGVLVDPPVTTRIVAQTLREAPYRSVGRMQIHFDPLTEPFIGSGWVVARRAFITAGHCVYFRSKGGWIYSAEFCPRYDASCPKEFVVETVYTLQGWLDGEPGRMSRQYDLAACVVTEPFTASEPPLPFDYFTVPALQYAALGYPTTPNDRHDFNGERMWQSFGSVLAYQDNRLAAQNDLTGGASGGPWLEASEQDQVGGITASRPSSLNDPNVAISPTFVDGFRNLYDAVKNL